MKLIIKYCVKLPQLTNKFIFIPLLTKRQNLISLLVTFLGNVSGLTAVVTSLGGEFTARCRVTFLGDVSGLTTSVTFDNTSLTVSGIVVWSSTLVTGGGRLLEFARCRLSGSIGTGFAAVLGNVSELATVVTLGSLGLGWTVTLNVS